MSRSFRERQQAQNQDRIWVYAMGIIILLMLVIVVWRWNEDRQPPQVRLGVPQVEAQSSGGTVVVSLNDAPQLQADGGVVAVRSGAFRSFVVRLTADHFEAFAPQTADRKPVRYDVERGMFVYQGNENVGFDRATGQSLTGSEDRLPRYLTRVTGSTVEIVTEAQ